MNGPYLASPLSSLDKQPSCQQHILHKMGEAEQEANMKIFG